ncbi:LysR family transcriptional regulator [Variovorax sp. WS11]|uniref:LysR family transcriptional regulator n=1 Tax=unclassified Variovorax TaxID=663243 RepID=UPI00088325EB|nr:MULTISPECIES: LysR family transcriptional regulator [unclassified Variovorax]NDZ11837.1 LysR family transcriptional regulator [Variovorax sp. WS11]PSL82275.1 LysR family transcriptional regulator [Variovorax sp. WS11]SDE79776.1 DNA-binding transcriptional regulator, LysR family [Variovorax sp. CF079]
MMIDLVQLRTFVAVAEEQHLTRAAERLHVSQSAASAHVRAIEENLDLQLFVRTNRSLELTRAGQMLMRQAKELLNGAAEFTSFARDIRGKVEGNLIVGASSDPTSSRIGPVIAELRAKHPLITVDLRARASAGTRQALKTGEIDIGMLLGRAVDAGFTYYEMATVNFRVVGPVAWKEKIESADWTELAELPWITPSDTNLSYAFMMEKLFAEKGLELNSVVRFDNSALARALVQSGVGMLLMREEYALQGEQEGYLALSPLARAEYPQFIAHVASRGNDPLIRAFVDAAAEAWPDMRRMAPLARR